MPENVQIAVKGLATHPNPLALPPGALVKADNVVIDREGIADSRPGSALYGNPTGTNVSALSAYRGRLVTIANDFILYDSTGTGTFTSLGAAASLPTASYGSPAARIALTAAQQSVYVGTGAGVLRLEATPGYGTTRLLPTGFTIPPLTQTFNIAGSPGFLAVGYQCAYRMVLLRTTLSGQQIFSAPSPRLIATNTGGTTGTVRVFFQTFGCSTNDQFLIYRSAQVPIATQTPDDEMQLVYQGNMTSAFVTAQGVVVVDNQPDSLRGATIYTAPSQQGIALANYAPPGCVDMTLYKTCMFYARTLTNQSLAVTLLGTGLLSIGSTVTISTLITYTAAATYDAATLKFALSTGGTPAQNIEATARSLAQLVSESSNGFVYGTYTSGASDAPGNITFKSSFLADAPFVFSSSVPAAFSPTLPLTSTADLNLNRVYFSKPMQPDAVPLPYYLDIGSADAAILRVLTLRNSVIVLKEDGCYRIIGNSPNDFAVSILDTTIRCVAPASATVLNNQVYCLCDQGVLAISENGGQIMSHPIEKDIYSLLQLPLTPTLANAIGDEPRHKYLLSVPTTGSDTTNTQTYCFNYLTNAWTRWTTSFTAGNYVVRQSSGVNYPQVFYAEPVSNTLRAMNTGYANNSFFSDAFANINITAVSGSTITWSFASGESFTPTIGTAVTQQKQFGNAYIPITAFVTDIPAPNKLTLDAPQPWDMAVAGMVKPISCAIQFAPLSAGDPGQLDAFTEATVLFADQSVRTMTVNFNTNFSLDVDSVVLAASDLGRWGSFNWGGVTWGQAVSPIQAVRTFTPSQKIDGCWLNVGVSSSQALSSFSSAGLRVHFDVISSKIRT